MASRIRLGRGGVALVGLGVGLGGFAALAGCGARTGALGGDERSSSVEQASELDDAPDPAAPVGGRARSARTPGQGETPAADGRVSRYVVLEGPGAIATLRGADLRSEDARARLARRVADLRKAHAALRPELEAAGAEIIADVVLVANTFQVRVAPNRLRTLRAMPGVDHLETPTIVTPSLAEAVPLVGAPELWEFGMGVLGEGMRIGVIDTGLDYLHADFGGSGDPADYAADDHAVVEASSFPTVKVIGGTDLAGDDYDALGLEGSVTPTPDDDPIDCGGHGTHVSGIAAGVGVLTDGSPYAGPWDSSLDAADFSVYPGAAPGASLYPIKIFGCGGSTDLMLGALEIAVDPDGDDDPSDRLDVVNASLGSAFALGAQVEADALASLTAAGSLFVAAAGNSGDPTRAHFAVGYPASVPEALAVAATFKQTELVLRIELTVSAPASVAGTYPVSGTDTEPNLGTVGSLSGEAVVADPLLACDPLTNAADMAGKIAIVERGTCAFNVKSESVADAGAVGMLIIDNSFTDIQMSPFNGAGGQAVPMWLLRRAEGLDLMAAAPLTVSLTDGQNTTIPVGPDNVVYFSSRGPTADALLLKPDLAAPGFSILSANVGTGFEGASSSGTSMACPLAAGAATLLRQARPELGPLEVKELLTSTAKPVTNALGDSFPSTIGGAGRIAVGDALVADIAASVDGVDGEVGASFGVVLATTARAETRTVVVTNHGSAAADLDVSLEPALEWPGATVQASAASIAVPAGGSATIDLTFSVDPELLPAAPAYEAFTSALSSVIIAGEAVSVPTTYLTEVSGALLLTPSGGADPVARLAYHGIARAEAEQSVGEVAGCFSGAGTGTASLALEGAAAHHDNATSVLELGTETSSFSDPTGPDASRDIVAVGALSDLESERVFFGIVTAADWVTPSKGWQSEVGIEIDTDDDQVADYLVTAESFQQPDPTSPTVFPTSAPFAQVVNLTSGALVETFQPVNSALPAYPGGLFFQGDYPETYETHIYFNRVLVFPVELAAIGLDGSSAALSYRGVSQVSRRPLVLGLPMGEPLDTTDWVAFDAGAPKLALPDCFAGTPLCPYGADSITLALPGEATAMPTLLVLHHGNGPEPSYETVDLSSASLESSNLSVSASAGSDIEVGESGTVTFTITNDTGTARAGAAVTVTVTGGTLTSLDASVGSCTGQSCSLGALASGASATVTAEAEATAAGTLTIAATATSTSGCDTDPSDDQASADFAVAGGPPVGPTPPAAAGTEDDSGCGCRVASHDGGAGWAGGVSLLVAGLAARRRRRR